MSSIVTYKNNTLTTVNNQTRVLNTRGTWLEDDITIVDITSPAVSVVDTTDSNGGTVRTITSVDISDTTAVASDVAQGKYFYTANGTKTAGTATGGSPSVLTTKTITVNGTYNASSDNADGYSSVTVNVSGGGGGGASAHTIHLEFSDETDTDINVYYDDALLGTMITAYEPVTYGGKTVTLAQLDNVTWYEPANIPIGVELIDYSKAVNDYAINSSGEVVSQEWYSVSDYTPVASGMTFSYTGVLWFYLSIYDSSKNLISSIYMYNDATVDQDDSNVGHGTLSGQELPSNAAYVRITGGYNPSSRTLSLIRTA